MSLENLRFVQSGMEYRDFLTALSKAMKCQAYFEIGVNTGRSLKDIESASVGVDPGFRLKYELVGTKPMLQLYQLTSDDFFASRDLTQLFGSKVDLAFLDGMHLFEFLLRDFINTEPHLHKDSVVLLHDCFPINAEMTERERNPRARADQEYRKLWAGDVWKLIPILRKFRPDLTVTCTNCRPTGLAVITGFGSGSGALKDQYDAIVAEFMDQQMTDSTIGNYYAANSFVQPESILARY